MRKPKNLESQSPRYVYYDEDEYDYEEEEEYEDDREWFNPIEEDHPWAIEDYWNEYE